MCEPDKQPSKPRKGQYESTHTRQVVTACPTESGSSNKFPKVVRQKNGVWREMRCKENIKTELKDLNVVATTEDQFFIDTGELTPKECERLIEMIAKDGNAAFARHLREKIGNTIYVEASKVMADSKAVETVIEHLASGVEIKDIPQVISRLNEQRELLRSHRNYVILNAANYGGLYKIYNQLAGDELQIGSMITDLTRYTSKDTDAPTSVVLYHAKKMEIEPLVKVARDVRERKAYQQIPAGTQWKDEKLDQSVRVSRYEFIEDSEKIKMLSERNINGLFQQLKSLDPCQQGLYDRLVKLPFTMKHATPAFHAIRNSGILSSLANLSMWDNSQKASGMSSEHNLDYKGDGDMAFFRFDIGTSPMETRYGPTTLVADASLLEKAGGWVSLHDQLVPLDRPAMRRLVGDNDEVLLRTSEHDTSHVKTGKHTQWTNKYPQNPAMPSQGVTVNFLDEVFYGEDIRPGIALSVLLELNRIGGSFKNKALLLTEEKDLRALIASLFRVEGKLPSSWKLYEAGGMKIHNPDGDGRYLRSGIIHPEGMAAGTAHDSVKRYLTMVVGVREEMEAKKSESPQVRHKIVRKLVSFMDELIKLCETALCQASAFKVAAEQEKEQAKSEAASRYEIAAKLVEMRQDELNKCKEEARPLRLLEMELGVKINDPSAIQRRIAYLEMQRRIAYLEMQVELNKMVEREDTLAGNDEWADVNEYLTPEEVAELVRLRRLLQ